MALTVNDIVSFGDETGAGRLQLDVCRGFQSASDQHLKWERQRLAFALANRGSLVQELAREFHPGRFAVRTVIAFAPQYQRVGAVQNYAGRVFKIVAAGVYNREIQTGLDVLQDGVAL